MSSHYHLLENFYLFKGWTAHELEKASHLAATRDYNVGDEIFAQGAHGTAFYIIRYGSVQVVHTESNGEETRVATIATGSHFGEMEFLDGEARSATVTAAERVEILAIEYSAMRDFLAKHPEAAAKFYHSLAAYLCRRLRATTQDLTFARERFLKHG